MLGRLPKARAALEYAARQHAGQRRSSDGAPFIAHPLEVGWLLYRAGAPDDVVAAGLLHDVLDSVSDSELRRAFGSPIARVVRAVSEDQGIAGYGQRKAALRRQVAAAGPEALLVFAADKVSKVRELRAAIATAARRRQPVDQSLFPEPRLAHFRNCLEALEQGLGDTPVVERLSVELTALNDDLRTHTDAKAVA